MARADLQCPDEFDPAQQRYTLPAYQQYLQGQAADCARQAPYLAWHGVILKRLGRYAEAAEWLELALMRAPERLGTRIDYAEALAALGDTLAAQALLTEILAEPTLPPYLQPLLQQRLQVWQIDAWQVRSSLSARWGYDSNLNSATRADQVTLTLAEGDVDFALGKSSRARGGAFFASGFASEATRRVDSQNTVQLFLDLRQRASSLQSDTDYWQGDLAALLRHRNLGHEDQWTVAVGNLAYDGQALYRSLRLGYGRETLIPEVLPAPGEGGEKTAGARCRPRLGGDLEFRRYPATPQLDSTLISAQMGYACIGNYGVRTQLRFGRELAGEQRPGGDAWRFDARLVGRHPLLAGWLEADLSLGAQYDDKGYSALLANGNRRRTERLGLRLEYQQALTRDWFAFVTLEAAQQWANIALFEVDSRALSTGLRYIF